MEISNDAILTGVGVWMAAAGIIDSRRKRGKEEVNLASAWKNISQAKKSAGRGIAAAGLTLALAAGAVYLWGKDIDLIFLGIGIAVGGWMGLVKISYGAEAVITAAGLAIAPALALSSISAGAAVAWLLLCVVAATTGVETMSPAEMAASAVARWKTKRLDWGREAEEETGRIAAGTAGDTVSPRGKILAEEIKLLKKAIKKPADRGVLNCPNCDAEMKSLETPAEKMEVCAVCRGVWYVRPENGYSAAVAQQTLPAVKIKPTAKEILACPVCKAPMTRQTDAPKTGDSRYWQCTDCESHWLEGS